MKNDTRQRLIEEAIKLFAKYGVDSVSTRQISSKAKVNICSISYYFAGKEGLFEACVKHLIAESIESFYPLREQLKFISSNNSEDRNLWEDLLRKYLRQTISNILSANYRYRFQLFLREQVSESKYGSLYFKEVWWPLKEDFIKIIEMLSNDKAADIIEIKFLNTVGMINSLFFSKNFFPKDQAEKSISSEFLDKYINHIVKVIELA